MRGIWCTKIGMTQVFKESGVLVPVTALDVGKWIVTQIKSAERDGYVAIQVGSVRKRYAEQAFAADWLQRLSRYFSVVREVAVDSVGEYVVGGPVDVSQVVIAGDHVHVSGVTIGRGFQGGVKRHGFAGGRGSHGDTLGRKGGSMGFMRSRGRVIKGWRMAGHMGAEQRTVKNLQVIGTEAGRGVILIAGSVPGKTGTLLYVQKA